MLNFRIHSFLEVYRLRSFSRAAEKLCLTQPAVSQHIKYLEEDFGRALFIVRGRDVLPTPEAEILYRYAETVEADARRTRERITAEHSGYRFRFGATRTIGEFVLPACIAAWLAEHPQSEISMVVDNSEALFAALHAGSLDFVFIEGIFSRDDYNASTLVRDRMIPVCASGSRFASRSAPSGPVDWSALFNETIIVREKGSGSRLLIEQALAADNLSLDSFRSVLEIGNIGAIKELVRRNIGISFLYERSVSEDLQRGILDSINLGNFNVSHDYSFVCLKNSVFESENEAFLNFCRSYV